MKLSIVTSYYNSEEFIDEQAKSILSQTYKNWEWIICDDFSNDGTKAKLIELSKKDDRIRLVTPKYKKEIWWNPQTYSTGDIVCPIDGDDAILPKTFEKIVHYFSKHEDVVLLHFNANKYVSNLPKSKNSIIEGFLDNVYISRDNKSFLDAFERLWPGRSNIFGYLRIFRNLPDLKFKVHQDGDDYSSNDGQWLLYLEERGICMAIPRTTYIARQHYGSENFRNWNIRGEANLVTEANERRKGMKLPMPRISNYYDDVYVAAESTYLSRLNWETEKKNVCFFNFDYSEEQMKKTRELFFDHYIYFDNDPEAMPEYDYSFVRINQNSDAKKISNIMEGVSGNVNLFCDNVHLHHNNRTGKNTLEEIKLFIESKYNCYCNMQDNRAILHIKGEIGKTKKMEMKETLLDIYEKTEIVTKEKAVADNVVYCTFIEGPKVVIEGNKKADYLVKFINDDSKELLYESTITNNCWVACAYQYAINWKIEIYENGTLWKTRIYDPMGQRVYVHLDSNSLGDSLAWMPVVDEFRKQKNCTVIISTHRNEMFEGNYPELTFVKPGTVVNNLYAMFGIGWYYTDDVFDKYKNPCDFKSIPLQQTASDILGIPFKEVVPKINTNYKRNIEGKYVCIAPHASAHAKYWNLPGGWQSIIDWLNSNGYKVVLISQEPNGDAWHDSKNGGKMRNVIDKSGDKPLKDRIADLKYASAFIGLGSGLSWTAWATGTPTILISGFSEEWTEFTTGCQRLINKDVCHGCFNREKLNAADWDWCPDLKGTKRQFECSKSISVDDVKNAVRKILPDLNN